MLLTLLLSQTKECHPCYLLTGETHDEALAGPYPQRILIYQGLSGGATVQPNWSREITFCKMDFDQ